MEEERIESVEQEEITEKEEDTGPTPVKKKKKRLWKGEQLEGGFAEIGERLGNAEGIKQKFSILWNHQRTNSTMQLGVYLAFFLFVAILFRSVGITPSEITTPENPMETFKNASNYEYVVTVNTTDGITTYEGIYFNGRSIVKINDQTFYFDLNQGDSNKKGIDNVVDNVIVESDTEIFPKVENLLTHHIGNLLEEIEKLKLEGTTLDSNDKVTAKKYIISADQFASFVFDTNANKEVLTPFIIKYENNKIIGFEIDLSSEPVENIKAISVTYSKFGEITQSQVKVTEPNEEIIEGE